MVDLIATVLLFVVSFLGVLLIPVMILISAFLSDRGAPGIALYGVILAMVGMPIAVVAVPIACVVWAVLAGGVTFYIPLVAIVGQVASVGAIFVLAVAVVHKGLHDDEKAKAARGEIGES